MTEYNVAYLFEQLPAGTEVSRLDWPFHVTISGNFQMDANAAEIALIVQTVAQLAEPIDVVTSQSALFGPERDMHVRLIEPAEEVLALHIRLADALEARGATLVTPFVRAEYIPHITSRAEGEFVVEQPLQISSLTLFTHDDPATARVVTTLPIGAP